MICISKNITSIILLLVAVSLTSACAPAPKTAVIGPDGALKILGPRIGFAADLENGTWVTNGDINAEQLRIVEDDGVRALLVHGASRRYTLIRSLDAHLLATPFLEWSWKVNASLSTFHETSLLIGFTAPPGTEEIIQPNAIPKIPNEFGANRYLSIRWGRSALARGHLRVPDDEIDIPIYVARGGAENADRWWREGLELSIPYAQLWPDEDISKVKVVFLAIVAGSQHERTPMHLADIDLFR